MTEVAGKLEGKVAFITGAARGQGRSHAIRLAQEGANIIAVDLCRQIDSVAYPMATPEDLAETVKEVEALDRRIVAREADVRDEAGLKAAFDAGVAELGPVDIVLANAGIAPMALGEERHEAWQDVIDVNLTGVFNTVETAIPSMIERGQGGAIVLTSSTAGINGIGGATRGGLGYTASKHGVVGLMRSYANTLAPHSIRVNSVHPTGVRTPMVVNEVMQQFLESDPAMGQAMANALPVDMVEPVDISNAILWLVSDDGRYVTGITVPVERRLHEQEVRRRDMAGRVAGKVAFITGAARGQGRSHAVRLAQEGADIIAVDVCEDMPGMPYAGATEAGPGRDGQGGRGAGPPDRRRPGRRPGLRRAEGRAGRRASPSWAGWTSSAPTPGSARRRTRRRTWPSRPGRT